MKIIRTVGFLGLAVLSASVGRPEDAGSCLYRGEVAQLLREE